MLLLLAFLGGVLTIVSPCILPVVPLVFARGDRPFRTEGLPMLAGLGLTFAVVATAATATSAWVVGANVAGRWAAVALLATVGVLLVLPRAANGAARPFVALGRRIEAWAERRPPAVRGVAVGAAVALLWAPCAGPLLGLVVAAAAWRGGGVESAPLFLAFAAGAALSLAVVLAASGRALTLVRRIPRADGAIRRTLGAVLLASVGVIALGWDQALYAKAGVAGAGRAEELLVARFGAAPPALGQSFDDFVREEDAERARRDADAAPLPQEGRMPELTGATAWLNSPPLSRESLRGKVVLVEFWTFACYNCLNALPHVRALEAKYRDRGFVVVGVHTPELPREKVPANVAAAVRELGIVYPVAIDNDYRIWNAFRNQYWPASYFVDRAGVIRFHNFGEGRYDEQDRVVAKLLAEPAPANEVRE